MSIKCPHCHDEAVLEGKIYNQPDYINPPAYFRPDKITFFQVFNSNIRIVNKFFACSCCGFVWSKIDSEKLQRFTPLEKAADFNRRSLPFEADGGLKPPSAQTVRERSSLTGFTVSHDSSYDI